MPIPAKTNVDVFDILAMEEKLGDWLIEPQLMMRGGAVALAAQTGVGKSWVASHIAQCLITGKPLFGATYRRKSLAGKPMFPVKQANCVLYIDYELPHIARKQRLPGLAAFPGDTGHRLRYADNPARYGLQNESLMFLHDLLSELKPDVLILDPFSSTHAYNENTNEIKQALNSIDTLRYQHGCAVLLIHHASSKARVDENGAIVQRRPLEMFRGHSSIVDWCDTALVLYDKSPIDENAEEDEHDMKIAASKAIRLHFAKTRYTEHRQPIGLEIDFQNRIVRAAR